MANGKGGGGPTVDQLKIAQQMHAMMEQMKTSADKISRSFESQAAATAEMAENMKNMGTGAIVTQLVEVNKTLKEVASSLANLKTISTDVFEEVSDGSLTAAESLSKLDEETKKTGASATETVTHLEDLREKLSRTGKDSLSLRQKLQKVGEYLSDEFPVAAGAALGALSGLQQTFSNLMSVGSGIFGFLGSLAGSLFEVGKSILAIPFKMFGSLMDMANSGGGGVSELAEAINGLRKEFGSLAGPTNTAIMGLSKSMGQLSQFGISATQMFGNLADRINLLKDLFLQGGAAIRSFSKEIANSGGLILAYQKGLGLSNEEMGNMAQFARRNGKTLKTVLNDVTKQSTMLGKAFGLDAKIISKEMAKASADMAHFGHMSQKQLGVAATYAQKMGFELSGIAGTLDQFTLFEDAAENVSTLNTAFGSNIDLNEVMMAQDPAEQSEIIRKGLLAQGVTMDKLDFRQRKLIKTATGWDDAAMGAMLSGDNMSTSLEDIKKAGEKAEKTVMTDAQAMGKLADAMDRVFKSGGERPKSFWDAFMTGLEKGFKMIPGVQQLFANIRKSTDHFTKAGITFAKMIYEKFPGIQKIVEAFKELFNPDRIAELLKKVLGRFGTFMDDLRNGKSSFKELMKGLKEDFFDYFKGSGPGASSLLDGFGEFFDAIKTIFAGALEWIMESLAGLITDIVDFLASPPNLDTSGIQGAGQKIISPFATAFENGWKVLKPALEKLFNVVVDMLKKFIVEKVIPKVKELAAEYWPYIAAYLFGPMLAKAALGAAVAGLGKLVSGLISKMFGGVGKSDDVKGAIEKMHKDIGEKLAKSQGQQSMSGPKMSQEDLESYKKMETSLNWSKIGQFLLGLAGAIAIGLVAYYAALKIVKGKSIQDIVAAGAVMGIVALVSVGMAKAFKELEQYDKIAWPSIGKFLVAMGTSLAIGIAGIALLMLAIKKSRFTLADVPVLLGVVVAMGVMGTIAAGIAKLASLVGKAPGGELLKGLIAIGVIVAGLVYAAAKMIDVLKDAKDVKPEAMEGAAKILDAIGTLAMKAGVIAGEAMIIGAIITSSIGIGGGALVIGLVAIAGIVAALAAGAMKIMKELAALSIGNPAEFLIKVDAFVKIMDVLLNMIDRTDTILNTLHKFTGVFSSLDEDSKMVGQVTKFVKVLFEGKSGSGGMKGLVDQMITAAQSIHASQVEPIKAFASLLDSLGKLISTVGDSATSFVTDTDSFWDNIGPNAFFGTKPAAVAGKMESLTKHIDTLFPHIKDIIKTMIDAMNDFDADPASLSAMGQTVGGILTAVGSLLQAIVPDGDKFKKTAEAASTFGADVKTAQVDTEGMAAGMQFVAGIMQEVSKFLPPLIKSIGDELVSIVNRVDKDKIGGLSAIGSILGAVAQLAAGLIPKETTVKFPESNQFGIGSSNVNNITTAAPDLGKMLNDLKDKLPALIDVIISAAQRMPTTEGFEKNIDVLQKIFEMLPNIASLAKELSTAMGAEEAGWFTTAAEAAKENQDKMLAGITAIVGLLQAVVVNPMAFPALVETLKKVGSFGGDAQLFSSASEKLKSLFKAISNLGEDSVDAIKDLVDEIDLSTLGDITNQIDKKLPSLTTLYTKFEEFAIKLGGVARGLNTMGELLTVSAEISPESIIKNFETTVGTIVTLIQSDVLKKAEGMDAALTFIQNTIGAGIVPTVKAVEDMVASARKLEESLNQGLKIDLDAKLKAFANNFGKVGAKGAYTVTARDVNINVSFNVSMDAQSIERIMINSSSSVIKNRLNLLIDAVQDSDAAEDVKKSLANNGKIPQNSGILPGG